MHCFKSLFIISNQGGRDKFGPTSGFGEILELGTRTWAGQNHNHKPHESTWCSRNVQAFKNRNRRSALSNEWRNFHPSRSQLSPILITLKPNYAAEDLCIYNPERMCLIFRRQKIVNIWRPVRQNFKLTQAFLTKCAFSREIRKVSVCNLDPGMSWF